VPSPLAASTIVALAVVVLAAFAVEAALGFGATVVTVALGAFLVPIESLLPAFVPLNMVLSLYLAGRYSRDVDRRFLFARIVPWMGLGLPLGLVAAARLGSGSLRLVFGVFVVLLSAFELRRGRRDAEPRPDAGRLVGGAVLFAAGVVHGLFATGGPLAVYVAGRELPDKARFRATLSALWLLLNVALVGSFAAAGRLGSASLALTAMLALPLLGGILLGEVLHRRVPAALFRTLVFALLLAAGLLLAAKEVSRG
jgi:uncharacterized membrane protein YfcA